ncbi:MAG: hypothetical protein JXR31_13800 [Prolixibacteraceae bacterium]|nr:hypothetical protein [Prolixibacteraceae bacterium]MBN2775325.1 hypothetical protein [Prolixibacteraceae bacterium]
MTDEKLQTEDDYREALTRFIEICNAPQDSAHTEELFKLIKLLEKYEKDNC